MRRAITVMVALWPMVAGAAENAVIAPVTGGVSPGSTWEARALPNCTGSDKALGYNTATSSFVCNTIEASGAPSGLIADFNGACPSGWSELTAARGRVRVGLPANGTLGATVGTALTDAQDKSASLTHSGTAVADHASHTHTYTQVPNHVHGVSTILRTATTGGATTQITNAQDTSSTADTTRKTDNPDGGVATGTTAGPSATLTHSVTQPDAHTVALSNILATVQYRACVKD